MALQHDLFGGDYMTLGMLESALDEIAKGSFMRLANEQQVAILTKLDSETFAQPAPPPAQVSASHAEPAKPGAEPAPAEPAANRLWRIVKKGIVVGYYTSEIGASTELAYELAAGTEYRADVAVGSVPYLSNYWMENVF